MPTQRNLPSLAEHLNKTCEDLQGLYDHLDLSCTTTWYAEECLNSPEKNGNIWDRLDGALDDPLIVDLIDGEGRDVVRTAFAMAVRRHRTIQFVEVAGKELAREHERVERLTDSQRKYESRNGRRNHNTKSRITERSIRVARLEKIIDEMRTVAGVLNTCGCLLDQIEYKDFGRIPEGFVEFVEESPQRRILRRCMEHADKVVARLHEDFPGLMAELPSNLLLAEGPEGQPARSTGEFRGRGIMLSHKKSN